MWDGNIRVQQKGQLSGWITGVMITITMLDQWHETYQQSHGNNSFSMWQMLGFSSRWWSNTRRKRTSFYHSHQSGRYRKLLRIVHIRSSKYVKRPQKNSNLISSAGNKLRETRRMRASMESRLYKHDSEKTWKPRSCEQELQNLQPGSQV